MTVSPAQSYAALINIVALGVTTSATLVQCCEYRSFGVEWDVCV